MNETFKQVQRLPVLTPAMMAGEHSRQTTPLTVARPDTHAAVRAAAPSGPARSLPMLVADHGKGERGRSALLALGSVWCVGAALAAMLAGPPGSAPFNAWVMPWLA